MAQYGAAQRAGSRAPAGYAAHEGRVSQQRLQADHNGTAGPEDSEELSIMGWGRLKILARSRPG